VNTAPKHEIFKTILRVATIESTNQAIKGLYKQGARLGTVLIAEEQTAGRGRGENKWASPKGGVYLSALLSPRDVKHITDLSILAGVAMVQAVREPLPKALEVGVKWPNDCLINWKKVGGILCEAIPDDPAGLCVVGIGINVNITPEQIAPFAARPFGATSFAVECPGGEFSVEQMANILLRKLENLYLSYKQGGFDNIRYLWERNCALVGKKVEITEKAGPDGKVVGTFLGLDDQGAMILAVGSEGERRRVVSGELTCYWR
jgi:BirA family biotin operon repressor/biotin-[acetyl-CoA-carboxylase] ligase